MASETRLKRDLVLINIKIRGNIFFHADSTTNAEGVGIYIKCKFNPCIYVDASQIHGDKYIFIKLRLKTSGYVFGVAYVILSILLKTFKDLKIPLMTSLNH